MPTPTINIHQFIRLVICTSLLCMLPMTAGAVSFNWEITSGTASGIKGMFTTDPSDLMDSFMVTTDPTDNGFDTVSYSVLFSIPGGATGVNLAVNRLIVLTSSPQGSWEPMGGGMDVTFSLENTIVVSGGGIYEPKQVTAPLPEPSTMLLFGTGLAGFAAWRYRKSKRVNV